MSATPIYEHVEFCSDPGTLWRKVESKWDWVGVKPDGTYVVGYPRRRGGMRMGGVGTVIELGATEGQHGVRTSVPLSSPAGNRWCSSPERAREEYERTVEQHRATGGPILMRVQLIVDGKVADEEFIARRDSTYR